MRIKIKGEKMNPQEELFKEVMMAISLYKESLDILDTSLMKDKTHDKAALDMHDARDYLFSFLETPQYENQTC